MSTTEKEPIPEAFEKWAEDYANHVSSDGPPRIRDHVYAEIVTAAHESYRHISSQKVLPHPEDVKEVEKAIIESLDNHLRIRGVGGDYISGKKEAAEHLALWMTGFWDAMDEGAAQWKADYENLKAKMEAQPSPGLPWVKCVVRMPQKDGEYPIRFIATGEKKIGHFGRNNIMFTDDNLSINKDYWEWLEETPFVQPIEGEQKLKEGDKVVLDRDFNNASVVNLLKTAKYYSTVSDDNRQWDVMTNRLSAIVPNEQGSWKAVPGDHPGETSYEKQAHPKEEEKDDSYQMCWKCNGTGEGPADRTICPECKGTGAQKKPKNKNDE